MYILWNSSNDGISHVLLKKEDLDRCIFKSIDSFNPFASVAFFAIKYKISHRQQISGFCFYETNIRRNTHSTFDESFVVQWIEKVLQPRWWKYPFKVGSLESCKPPNVNFRRCCLSRNPIRNKQRSSNCYKFRKLGNTLCFLIFY